MDWSVVAGAAAAAGVAGAGCWLGIPWADRRLAARALRRRCRETRTLVLTYDDGPGPALTPRVLDALRDGGARATFVLVSSRAARHPAVVDRIAADGHEIACHSRDHVHAWKSGPSAAVRDQHAGYEDLRKWAADDAPYRPPYGKLNLASWLAARRRNRRLAWWTLVSGDTYEPPPAPLDVVERARREGGGVVLLHDFDREGPDAAERAAFVLEATRGLLEMARQEGLRVAKFGEV